MQCNNRNLVKFMHRHPTSGRTLLVGSRVYNIGSDRRTLYDDCVGMDMLPGDGVDIVHNLEKPIKSKFDHIDCCSVLEHTARPWLVAANIEKALIEGGTLMVTVPFIWRVHGYPSDYWRMTKEAIPILFPRVDWREISYAGDKGFIKKSSGIWSEEALFMERAEVYAFGIRR